MGVRKEISHAFPFRSLDTPILRRHRRRWRHNSCFLTRILSKFPFRLLFP